MGGCPFARSATGDLATEDLGWILQGLGLGTGISLRALVAASTWMADQLGRPSPSRAVRALAADIDSRKAGAAATRHLIGLGRRRIAAIGTPAGPTRSTEVPFRLIARESTIGRHAPPTASLRERR